MLSFPEAQLSHSFKPAELITLPNPLFMMPIEFILLNPHNSLNTNDNWTYWTGKIIGSLSMHPQHHLYPPDRHLFNPINIYFSSFFALPCICGASRLSVCFLSNSIRYAAEF